MASGGDPLLGELDLDFLRLESEFQYYARQKLGKGGYGYVYLLERKGSGQRYALKEIAIKPKNMDPQLHNLNIAREREAMRRFDSPFIIKLHSSYHDATTMYFVMDLMEKADMASNVRNLKRPMQIQCVRFFGAEIVKGLEYLRSKNFVHRDLKLDNVLVDHNFHIKISDFGSAKTIGQPQGTSLLKKVMDKNSITGTPDFVAPEVYYREAVTFGTDYWALGFMLCKMYTNASLAKKSVLGGAGPYFAYIHNMDWSYPFIHVDRQVNDLIVRLTRRNPDDRPGTANFADLTSHSFFNGVDWENISNTMSPRVMPLLPCDRNYDSDYSTYARDVLLCGPPLRDASTTEKEKMVALFEKAFSEHYNAQILHQKTGDPDKVAAGTKCDDKINYKPKSTKHRRAPVPPLTVQTGARPADVAKPVVRHTPQFQGTSNMATPRVNIIPTPDYPEHNIPTPDYSGQKMATLSLNIPPTVPPSGYQGTTMATPGMNTRTPGYQRHPIASPRYQGDNMATTGTPQHGRGGRSFVTSGYQTGSTPRGTSTPSLDRDMHNLWRRLGSPPPIEEEDPSVNDQ